MVRAKVPGVDKKDLKVDLTGRQLRIQGERRKEETEEKGELVRSEIAWSTFSRTIHLREAGRPFNLSAACAAPCA